jgi:hypothetical protein
MKRLSALSFLFLFACTISALASNSSTSPSTNFPVINSLEYLTAPAPVPTPSPAVRYVDNFYLTTSTTDPQAINDAIASLPSTGGLVVFGSDNYSITSTITINNKSGVYLVGTGKGAASLTPASTFTNNTPVVEFINCRYPGVRDMRINGGTTSHIPLAGVESRVQSVTSGTRVSSTGLAVRNLLIGSDSSGSIVDGIKFSAETTSGGCGSDVFGCDQNNDMAVIENVDVVNYTGAAVNIGHSNSLLHRIIGGRWESGADSVKNAGGNFTLIGTNMIGLTGFQFNFQTGQYNHAIFISKESSESSAKILYASTSPIQVYIDGMMNKFSSVPGTPSVNIIDFNATGSDGNWGESLFSLSDSTITTSTAGAAASFSGSDAIIRLTNNYLDFHGMTINGSLYASNNVEKYPVMNNPVIGRTFQAMTTYSSGSSYNVGKNDGVILVDAMSGDRTIYLPASDITHGQILTIKRIDTDPSSHTVTVSHTVGNAVEYTHPTLAARGWIVLVWESANSIWWVIGRG